MPWMTIPIALGLAAAGSTAAQVYGQRSASGQNRRAIEASERSDTRAATIESARVAEERRALDERLKFDREESQRKKAMYDQAVATDNQRWQDYLRINEPIWRQGAGVLGSLYDIAGMPGQAPAFATPARPSAGASMSVPDLSLRAPMTAAPMTSTSVARPPLRRPSPSLVVAPRTGGMSLEQLMQLASLGSSMPKPGVPPPAYVGTEA